MTIFTDWKPETSRLWGKHPLVLHHSLHEHPLFTDEALADLIDGYPRKDYSLVVPGKQGEGQHAQWREGDFGGLSGKEVLQAISEGFLWLNLRNLPRNDEGFRRLADEIKGEMEERTGQKIRTFEMTLLITSPGAQTYYHLDVPGQSLWHIRGKKRAYLYPTTPPYLKPEDLEKVVMQRQEEEIPFEDWFDDYALVVDMEPGMMAHWEHFAPHRVENVEGLNISITTEHWTEQLAREYQVIYANGILRSLGITPRSTATAGLAAMAKVALQAAWRRAGLEKKLSWRRRIEFALESAHPVRMRDITPFELNPAER